MLMLQASLPALSSTAFETIAILLSLAHYTLPNQAPQKVQAGRGRASSTASASLAMQPSQLQRTSLPVKSLERVARSLQLTNLKLPSALTLQVGTLASLPICASFNISHRRNEVGARHADGCLGRLVSRSFLLPARV